MSSHHDEVPKAGNIKIESPSPEGTSVTEDTIATPAVASNGSVDTAARTGRHASYLTASIPAEHRSRAIQSAPTSVSASSSRPEHSSDARPNVSPAPLPATHLPPSSAVNVVPAQTPPTSTRTLQGEQPDDELMFPNNEDLINLPREVGDTAWNKPGGRGDWEFVPGTDLDNVAVGNPEPHKFVLIRRRPDNHAQQEFRMYPRFATFDWSDMDHIESLNKYRTQVINRTRSDIGKMALPFTQAEKDTLYTIVKEQLEGGANSETLDWDIIARDLAQAFIGQTQPKGAPLAQRTYLSDGAEVGHYKKPRKLQEDRAGAVERSGHNVRAIAHDYANVLKLLHDNQPAGTKERRDDPRWSRLKSTPAKKGSAKSKKRLADEGAEEGSEEGEQAVVEEAPSKKAKKAKKSLPKFLVPKDRNNNDPKGPKPPPPTSGAPFAGAIIPVS